MTTNDPEALLHRAEAAQDEAVRTHGWGSVEVRQAGIRVSAAQRVAAAARGDEYAEVIELGPPSSAGAPQPHVVASERQVILAYLTHVPDPAWDGTNPASKDPHSGVTESIAVIEFSARAHRFGGPGEDGLQHHPLWNSGLRRYESHVIENSRWIAQMRSARATDRHYLFTFHDSMLEVVGDDPAVSVVSGSYQAVLHELVGRL